MTPEHLLVFAVVLLAAVYLLRGFLRRKGGACGGCEGCASGAGGAPEPGPKPGLIQLEARPRRPEPTGPPEPPSRRTRPARQDSR